MPLKISLLVIISILEFILCLKGKRITLKLIIPISSLLITIHEHKLAIIVAGAFLGLYTYIIYTSIINITMDLTSINSLDNQIRKSDGDKPIIKYDMYKLILPIALGIVLYTIQFILSPLIFGKYYPLSLTAAIIFVISTVIFNIIIILKYNQHRIRYLIIATSIYIILTAIYNGNGCYGIGFDIQQILQGELIFDKITQLRELPILLLIVYILYFILNMIFSGISDIMKAIIKNNRHRGG